MAASKLLSLSVCMFTLHLTYCTRLFILPPAQYLPQMSSLKTVVIIFTLLGHYCADGKLEILRMDSTVDVRPGHNTTLPCLFDGSLPLNLSSVAVRWVLKTSEGEEKQVYWFRGGDRTQTRPGSDIPDSALMKGDGSLYIPNVQLTDEGEYTCTVIVTPDKATSKVTMRVSAKPTCTLSDTRIEMKPGTERSVTCYVNGFYPENVRIHWVQNSKASSENSELDTHTCTRVPKQNHDETYNVTSVLTVRPKHIDEDRDVYSCVIHHRSLEDPLTCNVTISVHEPENLAYTVLYWILIIIGILLPISAFLYYIYAPPKILQLPEEWPYYREESAMALGMTKEEFKELKKTYTVPCQIKTSRLNELFVKLILLTIDERTNIVQPWVSVETDKNQPAMIQCDEDSHKYMDVNIEPPEHRGLFSYYTCNITPKTYDGAQLTLQVCNKQYKSIVNTGQLLFSVTEYPYYMYFIEPNKKSYKAGDELELSCRIHSFHPEMLEVSWYKDKEEIPSEENDKELAEDNIYYIISTMRHRITEEDFGKCFTCKRKQTNTDSEDKCSEIKWTLNKQVIYETDQP